MNERVQFIAADLSQVYSMTELGERFGSHRHPGDTWGRSTAQGVVGLQEKSRAPHRCPHRLAAEVETALPEAKRAHPHWGPRQLLPYLARRRPELPFPAASPAGALFQRAGLSQSRQRRRRHRHPGATPLQAKAPHAVWTADFKGQFRTGEGLYCSPLTVADADSRLLLTCAARLSTQPVEARPIFERRFREYGLPPAIRTDHGAPFATPACCGLSKLSVWWITLGIRPQRIEPGRPEQNGAQERLHRTLQAEATRPPEQNQAAQQACCDRCCAESNEERPHEALDQHTPASLYQPARREMPAKLRAPESPGHFEGRRVSNAGTLRFQKRQLFLSDTLLQEDIG
jgi:putative transposase